MTTTPNWNDNTPACSLCIQAFGLKNEEHERIRADSPALGTRSAEAVGKLRSNLWRKRSENNFPQKCDSVEEVLKPMRISRNDYYLNIALECSRRGTCLRRNFGAIIVKNNQIVSTGYTGAPRGRANCCDLGKCRRIELNVPQGERYELCRSVHAETNAIISAPRWEMIDAIMYINGFDVETGGAVMPCLPCEMCKRLIINAGIECVITPSGLYEVRDWVWDEGKDKYSK